MAATSILRVPVSRRALLARVKRHLEKDGEYLHATRPGTRAYQQLGGYYVVNDQNHVLYQFDDLGSMAAELGLLKPCEHYDESEG